MMRIVIFSGLVAGSMAACAGDGFYLCGYDTHTNAVAAQSDGPGGSANTVGCAWFFDGICNSSLRADGGGTVFSVPWPVTTNHAGATLSKTNFVIELGMDPLNMKVTALGGAVIFGTANATFAADASCAIPQLKYFDVAACGTMVTADQVNTGACASASVCNGADDSHGLLASVWNGGSDTFDITAYNDAVNTGRSVDLTSIAWTAAADFTIVDFRWFTDTACSSAVAPGAATGGALKITASTKMPLFNHTVTANAKTVAGICNSVKADTSYKLVCNVTTGTVTHEGYPADSANNCGVTLTAANTTTWAPSTTDTGATTWSTAALSCIQWKGSDLYVQLWSTASVPVHINDNTALATICSATAAPTAAPASGAAAVGTAAAVAAGAAALIL